MNEIRIKIKEEQDLYEPFNPEKELHSDVTDYLSKKMEEVEVKEPICFHILSETPVDEAAVQQAFYRWSDGIQDALKRQKQIHRRKQAWMFAVGVGFIVLSLILEAAVTLVTYTILSTIGAFAMWEAAAIWIVENPKNRVKKRIIRKITQESTFQFTVE